MKIGPSPQYLLPREMPAKAGKAAASTPEPGVQTPAAAASSPASTPPTTRSDGPPGLVKLAARFAAMEGNFKNAGQEQAASRIQQNLDRYRQNQALATPPAAPLPPTTAPAAPEAPAASAPTEQPPGTSGTTPTTDTPVAAAPEAAPATDAPAAAPTANAAPADPVVAPPSPNPVELLADNPPQDPPTTPVA